jgi:hypothetical protein
MKTTLIGFPLLAVSLCAGPIEKAKVPKNPPPPIVSVPATSPTPQPSPGGNTAFVYQQQSIAGRAPLVSQEQARAVIDRFKAGYPKLSAPRLLVYVNRELIDESSGLRMVGRTEKTDQLKADLTPTGSAGQSPLGQNVTIVGNASVDASGNPVRGTSERVIGENTYSHRDRTNAALADRQTIRDVERLMGRPLRLGGARLTDQRVATQLLADRSVQEFLGTTGTASAAKDREALLRTADVVVEVLISSRSLPVPGVSGDLVYEVPDIQATAIRLADAHILGQASSADILGPDRFAGRVARNYDVREITEAVALALMEDMMQGIQ